MSPSNRPYRSALDPFLPSQNLDEILSTTQRIRNVLNRSRKNLTGTGNIPRVNTQRNNTNSTLLPTNSTTTSPNLETNNNNAHNTETRNDASEQPNATSNNVNSVSTRPDTRTPIEKEVDVLYYKWNQAEIIFDKYKSQLSDALLSIEYRLDVLSQLLPVAKSLQKLIKTTILVFLFFVIFLPLLSGFFKLTLNDIAVVIVAFVGIFVINLFKKSILS